jgi:flagellar biosynthesis protein FlhF
MHELHKTLAAVDGIRALLMLTASAQDRVLVDTIRQFSVPQLHSAVLTRTDEARSLGGAIGALIETQLAVSAVSSGSRIPEDLGAVHANEFVDRAMRLTEAGENPADQEVMAERFGGALHVA